jgi:uncharacterized protein with HEPN domain
MQLEARKYLFDIQEACARIADFTAGRAFEDYTQDAMLRSAVERQFEIVGEAMSRLLRTAPDLEPGITDCRKIIAFRNILIHAYATVSDAVVWGTIETNLEVLRDEIAALVAAADRADQD